MRNKKLAEIFKLFTVCIFFVFTLLHFSTNVFAQDEVPTSACGTLRSPGQYGPWDYRTDRDKLPIVLNAHFTPEVETLIRGKTSDTPGGDISYTLSAIPNNHRALIAMMRLAVKEKTEKPNRSHYTVECWFERAIRFRPDDSIVRMIYSTYLQSKNRTDEANAQLAVATIYAKDNPFTHYNIGLHYYDLNNYDRAYIQAQQAISLGWQHTDLRDKLQSVGKWPAGSNSPDVEQVKEPLVDKLNESKSKN